LLTEHLHKSGLVATRPDDMYLAEIGQMVSMLPMYTTVHNATSEKFESTRSAFGLHIGQFADLFSLKPDWLSRVGSQKSKFFLIRRAQQKFN
jgi:hypothetical protein